MGKICNDIRKLIVSKRLEGQSFRMIGKCLKIGHSTVAQIWNKYLANNSVEDLEKCGRPFKRSIRDRRMICWTSKKQPFLTPGQLGEATEMLKKVSIRTIKRYLCSSWLRGRMASLKPFLIATHVRNRKKWCAAYLNMDTEK